MDELTVDVFYYSTVALPASIPSAGSLLEVVGLFRDTLDAISGVPVFSFFLMVLLFLAVVSLLALLVRHGRRGRL